MSSHSKFPRQSGFAGWFWKGIETTLKAGQEYGAPVSPPHRLMKGCFQPGLFLSQSRSSSLSCASYPTSPPPPLHNLGISSLPTCRLCRPLCSLPLPEFSRAAGPSVTSCQRESHTRQCHPARGFGPPPTLRIICQSAPLPPPASPPPSLAARSARSFPVHEMQSPRRAEPAGAGSHTSGMVRQLS